VKLAAVVYDYHLRPLVGEAEEARISELRGLIERMGEINLTAIEESEELQKRFDFLTTQRADLDSAIEQLESAIEKINRASRKRFRETFDAVNAKFQEVFPRLFGGGRASLQLTDEGDLLETGVEIIANPPGKKVMQNIEIMSGGEKALTAVSLLFAIFLVKPSPFCLLDEVDAPLDEANVGRFNEVVREMTDRSQFIMITHNRRTMEIADRLCGITMEEPGVSKLVAVNLKGGSGRIGRATVATVSSPPTA
jgi:chromosome segregation protein